MRDSSVFVDTNILVYAHDKSDPKKYELAKELIASFWNADVFPFLSVQVLQEFYVTLVRKGVSQEDAAQTVDSYLEWRVVENTAILFRDSLKEQQRWKTSYWGALVLAAARYAGVSEILSEDFSAGQDYDGIVVVNPLLV